MSEEFSESPRKAEDKTISQFFSKYDSIGLSSILTPLIVIPLEGLLMAWILVEH